MMEGNSCSFDAVNIKNEPEYEFNEQVHVKVEIECLKEEAEWGDSAGVEESPLSSLYAGHQVKDELVLGPEGLQPRDVAFTQTAHARGGHHHEHTYAGTQPPGEGTPPPAEETLEDSDPSRGGSHRDHTYAKTESSNAEVHVKEEVVECLKEEAEWEDSAADVASLYAGHEVKGELVLGPEGLQPRDIAFTLFATQASAVTAQPKLKDCVVRLERIDDLEAPLGTDTRRDKRRVGNNADVGHEIHSNSNIGDEKENYECDICKKRFDLKTQLMEHVMIHIHQSTEQEEINVADNVHVKEEVVECLKEEAEWEALAVREQPVLRDCAVRLERIDSLETLLEGTRRVEHNADVGNRTHTTTNIATEKESYVCDICKNRFDLKTQLVEHVMTHIHGRTEREESKRGVACNAAAGGGRGEGREPTRARGYRYSCEICKKKFPTPSMLKRHEGIHTGERPFACRICEKKFTQSSSLKTHERTHTGAKPFSCGICKQKFARSSNLKTHERTHTGEKPFICGICKQKFAQASNLKKHERTHTGERPFSCGICKQKFTQSSHLKVHEQTHTGEKPFSCGICKQKFAQSRHLKVHEQTHTGEKPFSCGICQQKFAQASNLKTHERTHTGEKPFCCGICKRKFAHSSTLKKHERTHESTTIRLQQKM